MQKIHYLILFWLFTLFPAALCAQNATVANLYSLEKRIAKGDKTAFIELAPNLDDRSACSEMVGLNSDFKTKIRNIAQRILVENSRFFNVELKIDSTLTASEFKTFLTENDAKLQFDKRAEVWLLTPLEDRNVDYIIRKVSDDVLDKIAKRRLTKKIWVIENGIDLQIEAHKNEALWQIAAHLMRSRSKFNRPDFTSSEHTDLLRILTGSEVGVKGDLNGKKDATVFDMENDYSAKAQLNLLIYYLTNYQNFEWDNRAGYFKNTKEMPQAPDKLTELYDKLKDKNETIAIGAFVVFAETPSDLVEKFYKEHKPSYSNEWNTALPHEDFGIRFLQQLTQLTAYCRENKIDYKGAADFHKYWAKLRATKDFNTRYSIENEMIKSFTAKDITPLEFWGIVYQNDYQNTFSVGRILDKWYSKHWSEIMNDPAALALYLKKTALFRELGMVGNCNNYLRKFANLSPEKIEKINSLLQTTADNDIRTVATQAANLSPVLSPPANPKTCTECTDYTFEDLEKSIDANLFKTNNNLDFKTIYEILKYDAADAFIGGGGTKRSEGIENAIKVLEANFKTTLGFEQKRYKANYWYVDCIERATEWQQYLEEKKLVNIDENEPESMTIR